MNHELFFFFWLFAIRERLSFLFDFLRCVISTFCDAWNVRRRRTPIPPPFNPTLSDSALPCYFFYGYHNNPVDSVCASHIFYLSSCDYKITDGSLWWNFQGNFSLISLIIVNMVDRSGKTWNFCYPRIQFSERKIHQRHIFHPWGFRRPENNAQWFSIVNRIYHTSELNFSRALIG